MNATPEELAAIDRLRRWEQVAVVPHEYDTSSEYSPAGDRVILSDWIIREHPGDQQVDREKSVYDEIIRKRKADGGIMSMGRHTAANANYCKEIIESLQSSGNNIAADWAIWMLWWRVLDRQTAEQVDSMRREEITAMRQRSACPCVIADEPCSDMCPCVMPQSSRGCMCCARYGSAEQRKIRASQLTAEARARDRLREER